MHERYVLSDEQWLRIEPLLPAVARSSKGGRPREDDRRMMSAIYYVLRTGIPWNALPRELGASTTVFDRFQEWREAGVFERLWAQSLGEFDQRVGIEWTWQAMDGVMTKAPLGGEKNGTQPDGPGQEGRQAEPCDRRPRHSPRRGGSRRKPERQPLLEETLDARVVQPLPHEEFKQNLCLDKGYDTLAMPARVEAKGLIPHIRSRGEEKTLKKRNPRHRARRWVVERTHSWINKVQKLFIRREKKAGNYLALIQLACAVITLRSCEVFE